MSRTVRTFALAAAALAAGAVGRADAQVVVSYYTPPAVAYYPAAPAVAYYPAPAVSYYAPAPVVAYYAAPRVAYYPAPAAVAPGAVVTATTRYGLFGRRSVTTSAYYPPAVIVP